jgi:glycosyltransferase involved in cell wall biosynthesis
LLKVLAVTNMYPRPEAPTSGTFVEQQVKGLRELGLQVEVHLVERSQKGMFAYFGAQRQVAERVRSFRPDLVHVMYGGVMADMITRSLKNVPTVVSFCGSDLLGELLSGRIRKMIASYGVWSSWQAARRASGIIVKSRNLQQALPCEEDRRRAHIIPNGIDLERFRPLDRNECRNALGWPRDGFNVLFPTNTGDPRKRIGLARGAVAELGNLGVIARLRELQDVAHDQVPVWINACDVVILTSLHEGSPNVIKEALACNVPIVSVDVGDVAERVEDIEGCFIADATPSSLAEKLHRVLSGSRRVEGRTAMRELSLERVAARVKTCYLEAVSGAGRRAATADRMTNDALRTR